MTEGNAELLITYVKSYAGKALAEHGLQQCMFLRALRTGLIQLLGAACKGSPYEAGACCAIVQGATNDGVLYYASLPVHCQSHQLLLCP